MTWWFSFFIAKKWFSQFFRVQLAVFHRLYVVFPLPAKLNLVERKTICKKENFRIRKKMVCWEAPLLSIFLIASLEIICLWNLYVLVTFRENQNSHTAIYYQHPEEVFASLHHYAVKGCKRWIKKGVEQWHKW